MLSGAQVSDAFVGSGTGRPDYAFWRPSEALTAYLLPVGRLGRGVEDKVQSEQIIADRRRLCGSIDFLCGLALNARTGIRQRQSLRRRRHTGCR